MSTEMDAARERRLEELFHAAREVPREQRAEFLSRRCGGDGELHARLESLLSEDERGTRGILGSPLFPSGPEAGEVIGPYRLLERVGEGGMGAVFLAEQLQPIQRRVALKTLRVARPRGEVLARFDAERQALARLDHPGIAQIYDAGSMESGLPWFAMEYAPGPPISEYCDVARLTVAERLELFLRVCEAVQHAHQKGVIHRDLKPANVLVVQRDGRATPKVIDFGIARAISGTLGPEGSHTASGQVVGTYVYMSPEQAEGSEVDTRADIWSLGAILCELLCGAPPFEAGAVPALVVALLREDPEAPSRKFSRLGAERARAVARCRRVQPGALVRRLSGDLDGIVLKALERDRGRRYAAASELATDLRRHLAHEPVSARPPTASYRAAKFVRRHRLMVSATAFAVGGLLVAVVALAAAWREADARARELDTRRLVSAARLEFLDHLLFFEPETAPRLAELLGRRAEGLGTLFADRLEAEAAIRTSVGTAWINLGDLDRARAELERALEIRGSQRYSDPFEHYLVLEGLVRVERRLGEAQAAEARLERMLALVVDIALEWDRELASCLAEMVALRSDPRGTPERAARLLEEFRQRPPDGFPRARLQPVLRVVWETGLTLLARGHEEQGAAYLEEVERIARARFDEDPLFLLVLWKLASSCLERQLPDPDRALELAEELELRLARQGLPGDHWLVVETGRLLAAARSGHGG